MDLIPGRRYRFQTSDNRVPQIGRFIRRVDDTYIFNVNGIETSYHMNTLLGMQPRANGIGFDDMFLRDDGPIGGKMHMHGKSRNRNRNRNRNRRKQRKSRKNSKK